MAEPERPQVLTGTRVPAWLQDALAGAWRGFRLGMLLAPYGALATLPGGNVEPAPAIWVAPEPDDDAPPAVPDLYDDWDEVEI